MRAIWKSLLVLVCALVWPVSELAAQPRPWQEYRTIMWMGDSPSRNPEKLPLFFRRLHEMGVNTAMVYGDADPSPILTNKFPYYVENVINRGLCLKFSSKVTDWDKFVSAWAKAGRPEASLARDYCLDDPQWRGWARKEMESVARKNRDHHPLAYNIRDELSTTISANPFDYDFNSLALAGFRKWLAARYPDLAALNAEWETQFRSWEEVRPFTTDQIKNRMASGDALPRGHPDWQALGRLRFDPASARTSPVKWNFSPWADFRTYMDISLASTLNDLRAEARQADPATPVGIEGTQMPSAFGGYDLFRLAGALDWVEPYDIGSSREILASFMPNKPILTTVFESDTDHARRRLWHLLLEGDRGCIIWWSEDCLDWKNPELPLTRKGRNLAPALKEMTSPLAQLFLRAQPLRDPIFFLYSQPSIQADWLIESTVDGSSWFRRFSSYEATHNRAAQIRDSWLKAFEDLGCTPQFVADSEIETGAVRHLGNAVLVLPSALALSDKAGGEIRSFLRQGSPALVRRVFADGTPGAFDEHCRLRTRGALEDFFPASPEADVARFASNSQNSAPRSNQMGDYAAERLRAASTSQWAGWIQAALAPLTPEVSAPVEARVRIHRYQAGPARLLAFERNVDYQMSEDLKQAGGNEALEKPVEIEATLKSEAHVYDLRRQVDLGRTNRIRFVLDPWQPSLFALTEDPLPPGGMVKALLARLKE